MLNRFRKERDGQEMVEYGLLVALVALAAAAALSNLSGVIDAVWTSISNKLSS